MSFLQTALLGGFAGLTIYLGLPFGRVSNMPEKIRTYLSMLSAGILLFLFIDIFEQIADPVESALAAQAYADFAVLLAILAGGFALGLLGLILFDRRFVQGQPGPNPARAPQRLALMIAAGIGLHNFSEGLAIGQSAGAGHIALAAILIIGFGLHNATEGFGIVGPLVGKARPTWKFLGLTGLIGGGPTFLGTLAGYWLVSPLLAVLFLSLACGALVFILGELFNINRQPRLKLPAGWGLFTGFLVAYLTDLVLKIAGV
ncbi:MAG TPA: ZIP family metal transporter [Anaerolineales bacterium]|nr:ZIP family metal transporter [Anaerolineales bacterium]